MGRIFSAEQLACNEVPEPGDFAVAARQLLSHLSASTQCHPEITGALVFGSTTAGKTTLRSDLDVLVAYDQDMAAPSDTAVYCRELFRRVEWSWHTPVEPILESTTGLANGQHSLDPIFARNLQTVPPQWSAGRHPFRKLQLSHAAPMETFYDYAASKNRKFSKALMTHDGSVDYAVLQRALELPTAIGRKYLQARGVSFVAEDRQAVAAACSQNLEPTMKTSFSGLSELDSAYTKQLLAQRAGTVSLAAYDRWLMQNYESAVAQAHDLSSAFLQAV